MIRAMSADDVANKNLWAAGRFTPVYTALQRKKTAILALTATRSSNPTNEIQYEVALVHIHQTAFSQAIRRPVWIGHDITIHNVR
jgi:hypothetical protein